MTDETNPPEAEARSVPPEPPWEEQMAIAKVNQARARARRDEALKALARLPPEERQLAQIAQLTPGVRATLEKLTPEERARFLSSDSDEGSSAESISPSEESFPPEVAAALAARRSAAVHDCAAGCGTKLETPGRCWNCQAGEITERELRIEALDATIATVPASLRWSHFGAPELGARVKDARGLAAATALKSAPIVVLRGPAGVGKTVTAVALLMREAQRRLGGGFFVDAFALSVCRQDSKFGETPALETRATEAAILVLDDLCSERIVTSSPIPDIIHARHARAMPMIVTTWASDAEIAKRYGAGVARRLFERAVVIEMAPRRAPKPSAPPPAGAGLQ